MERPDRETWAMEMALLTAQRGTCLRRQVGAVLLSARGHVLATGYNGVAAGLPHCNEEVRQPVYHDDPRVRYLANAGGLPGQYVFQGKSTQQWRKDGDGLSQCVGFEMVHPFACTAAHAASGKDLDGCGAIHAEQNALLQCRDVYAIHSAFVTASPCITCTKLLLNTSCQRIHYLEEYPHPAAKDLWLSAGREWLQLPARVKPAVTK
jgi:dCMP deaminase